MNSLESIILFCIKQLNSERTIYSVYHLLNGKKSSQTIQDAHLYSLKSFFGIYEPLTRETYDTIIKSLVEKKWLSSDGDQHYSLTPSGEAFLLANPLPQYINGWRYHQQTTLFWERLSFFIQVTSNLVFKESNYIPIQKNLDVHAWLKSVLKQMKFPREELGSQIYHELMMCFNETIEIDPSVLIFRLTGYQKIGLTAQQIAKKLNMNVYDYHIEFINILHYLIRKIQQDVENYKILPILIADIEGSTELTRSSSKTWELLSQGYSHEKIAYLRNLKLSTIEDHLVEFALNVRDFSIEPYVDNNLQSRVLEISRALNTKQLKVIRKNVEMATYFQIRLVLAKYGDR